MALAILLASPWGSDCVLSTICISLAGLQGSLGAIVHTLHIKAGEGALGSFGRAKAESSWFLVSLYRVKKEIILHTPWGFIG